MISKLILYSGFAGITVIIGGLIAYVFENKVNEGLLKEKIVHFTTSFGAGIILSALALVLIPMGLEKLELIPLSLSFIFGALLFFLVDYYLAKKSGRLASLLAMLMDFIPESIALGAIFATDINAAILLAIFIGLQNLPESFNSYHDLKQNDYQPRIILLIFFVLSFFGIFGALTGHFLLSGLPEVTAHLMIFASGGILYLLFQDIVPQSKLEGSYITSLGASFGFLVGLIGEKVI